MSERGSGCQRAKVQLRRGVCAASSESRRSNTDSMYEYREGQTTHGVSSEDWLLWIRWSHLEHVYCIFIRAHCNATSVVAGVARVVKCVAENRVCVARSVMVRVACAELQCSACCELCSMMCSWVAGLKGSRVAV